MVYMYDTAIINDLRQIFSDDRIHIVPPEDAFDLIGTLKEDTIVFPFISLQRPGWQLIDDTKTSHLTFEGKVDDISIIDTDDDVEDANITRLQALPIRINYQIDVWTESRKENDAIMRELIWYYTLYPTLNVDVEYENIKRKHHFNIFFDNDIEDNSDLTQHSKRGRYFRQTIGLYTNDAYLWKTFSRKPNVIDSKYVDVVNKEI